MKNCATSTFAIALSVVVDNIASAGHRCTVWKVERESKRHVCHPSEKLVVG